MNELSSRTSLIIFALATLVVAIVSLRSLERHVDDWPTTNDFAHQAITSHRILAGENPYLTPLSDEYAQHGLRNKPRIDDATNPPFLSLVVAPFAILPTPIGFWFWTAMQLCALFYSIISLCRLANVSPQPLLALAVIGALTVAFPTVAHIEYGQSQCLMLGLAVAGIVAMERGRNISAALLWGAAASLKLFLWPLGLIALLRGGLRSAVAFALTVLVLFFGFPLLWVPLEAFQSFFTHAIPAIQSCLFRFNAGIVLVTATVYSLQAFHAAPATIAAIIPLLNLITSALAACVTFLVVRRPTLSVTRIVAATLCIATIFAPTGWNHYGVFFYPALIICLGDVVNGRAHAILNPISLTFLYVLVSLNRGRILKHGMAEELLTSWMGPVLGISLCCLVAYFQKTSESAQT